MNCLRCGRPPEAHTAGAVRRDVTPKSRSDATPDRLALATRTKRARHTSRCDICHGVILPGMTIARLTSPAAWVHVRCVPAVAAATKGK